MSNRPSPDSLSASTDVLIAGAGPSGLALAAELRRAGVASLVVDRQPEGANTSRACVVHARTLEVLEPLGVSGDLLAEGVKVPIFRARDRDHALMIVDFSRIASAYPFTLMVPQNRVEHHLLAHLQALGGGVARPAELTGLVASADGVAAQVRMADTTRIVHARWLVGADGMHSTVRDKAGIDFAGAAYAQSFVLADVRMDWPISREEVSLFFSPDGLVVVAPLPHEHYRIVATVDEAPEAPSAAFMQAVLDARGPATDPGRIRDVAWSSRFHVHHRMVRNPRKGRILLVGDAAHVHSPAGGQGMNTGLQDSVSLADVLAATLKDGAEVRLDAWAARRHGIAANVVALTDRMTRMATLKSRAAQTVRNLAIASAGRLPPVRAALANRLAELNAR